MRRLLGATLGATLLAGMGCQTYDFEPVKAQALTHSGFNADVTARGLPPDMMMLLDRSTSMKERDGSAQSRLDQMKSALSSFLGTYGQVARIGMVAFIPPGGGACQASTLADITKSGVDLPDSDDPTVLQTNADAVNAAVVKLDANGIGTPTAGSLANLAGYTTLVAPDPFRRKFVVLLTDGLPNCNPNNANNQCSAPNAACQCVLTASSCTSSYDCARGCVDSDATVSSIQSLLDKGVQTIVIGFGSDAATGPAPTTLSAMAKAGGFQRTCDADTDCNGEGKGDLTDTCNTAVTPHVCKKLFYAASNGDALGLVLKKIVELGSHPCEVYLNTTVDNPQTISVTVDGVTTTSSETTWKYDPVWPQGTGGAVGPAIVFAQSGAICTKLKASTTVNPVKMSIQIVKVL